MQDNEDEPDDVKNSTPVESAILDGNKDETKESKGRKPKSAPRTFHEHDHNRPIGKKCNLYRAKFPSSATKTKKTCHPKTETICRDNLSKDEYIDVLSTPKKIRRLPCRQPKSESENPTRRFSSSRKLSCKEKIALPRPMSQRLEELAKPKPNHVMNLLQTWGNRLRPEIIDTVQKSLEENCAMSPEQMEAYYNEKEREDCIRVHRVRRKKYSRKEKKKQTCDDHMDPEAVCEEYEMAQRFMRHIISHLKNCPFTLEDHYDLTEVILFQLGGVLDYRPSGDGDRKFQMMFMLANGIACWVHGLNVAVAEKLAKQKAEEAKIDEESGDEDTEEEEKQEEVVTEVTEDEEEKEEEEDRLEKDETGDRGGDEGEGEETGDEENKDVKNESSDGEVAPGDESTLDTDPLDEFEEGKGTTNVEEDTYVDERGEKEEDTEGKDGKEDSEQESEKDTESVVMPEEREDTEPPEETPGDEKEVDEDAGEEAVTEDEDLGEETEEEMETDKDDTDIDIASIPSMEEPGIAIQGLGEGDLFASEIPFVTFGKIMEIVVKFLDRFQEAETTEVRRRLQNAILRKLTNLVLAEAPDALDNKMKAVLEVLAENIAVFMEETLPKSKVNEVQTMAPEIESREVREWGHWLESVMDNATNWGKWIHEKVGEAEEKARTKVTRGDWQDWTKTVNSEALKWRMFNLDTKHRMHHADLNLTHKKVVHRGGLGTGNAMRSASLAPYPEKDEAEINAYDLSDDLQSLDQTE